PPDDTGAVVARLTPTGALDCSFGSFGRAVLRRPGTTQATAAAVTLDGDGRILTAGSENAEPIGGLRPSQLVTRTLGGGVSPPERVAPAVYTMGIEGSATGGVLDGFV